MDLTPSPNLWELEWMIEELHLFKAREAFQMRIDARKSAPVHFTDGTMAEAAVVFVASGDSLRLTLLSFESYWILALWSPLFTAKPIRGKRAFRTEDRTLLGDKLFVKAMDELFADAIRSMMTPEADRP